MSFCFLLYLWMPPQKNMQRGNWLGNGYLCVVNLISFAYWKLLSVIMHLWMFADVEVDAYGQWNANTAWYILMLKVIRYYWFFHIRLNDLLFSEKFIFSFILIFSYCFQNSKLTINAIESVLLNTYSCPALAHIHSAFSGIKYE